MEPRRPRVAPFLQPPQLGWSAAAAAALQHERSPPLIFALALGRPLETTLGVAAGDVRGLCVCPAMLFPWAGWRRRVGGVRAAAGVMDQLTGRRAGRVRVMKSGRRWVPPAAGLMALLSCVQESAPAPPGDFYLPRKYVLSRLQAHVASSAFIVN